MLAVAAYMAFKLFRMALAKEEKRGIAYERLKLKRIEVSWKNKCNTFNKSESYLYKYINHITFQIIIYNY